MKEESRTENWKRGELRDDDSGRNEWGDWGSDSAQIQKPMKFAEIRFFLSFFFHSSTT